MFDTLHCHGVQLALLSVQNYMVPQTCIYHVSVVAWPMQSLSHGDHVHIQIAYESVPSNLQYFDELRDHRDFE